MQTFRLKASSICNYEMIIKAKSEEDAYEYAAKNSHKWKEIEHSDDWQDDGCEVVN